jgi:xanthine/CO dehydrogenase XdhC/CoxF family maturation factor
LAGAGNDAQVLAQMAVLLGWKVVVADGRYTHANSRRFGPACQLLVGKPEKILENVRINDRTAFVLMSHNYPYDLAALKMLLAYPDVPYIGILGPRKRYQRMLDALQEEGLTPSPDQSARIYAPIGLDLGAENAAEIGFSILSEIMAVFNQSNGAHLRERSGAIHDKRNSTFNVTII